LLVIDELTEVTLSLFANEGLSLVEEFLCCSYVNDGLSFENEEESRCTRCAIDVNLQL